MNKPIRHTLVHLLKAPGYTTAIVMTLALAVAANTAIFSAVHAVLLDPLPLRQPKNLVIAWKTDAARNLPVIEISYNSFRHWQAQTRSFEQMAAMGSSTWPSVLDGRGESVRLSSAGVSASFFETLGARPLLGRAFRSEDDVPNAPRVVVLSHATWVQRFGADPAIVDTSIRLDEDQLHTVVGVMPRGFDFPRGTDYWTPIVPILAHSSDRWKIDALENVGVLYVIGRLRDGVTPAVAAAELDRVARSRPGPFPPPAGVSAVAVTPFLDYVLGPVRLALWLLLAAVAVLLLIACANVSGLMLTRVTLRRREHAIRLALGASRFALGRQWALEAALLSATGGVLGFAASRWVASAIVALAPDDIPRLADVAINFPVALFTLAAVFFIALLCGAGPVFQASASNLVDALNESAGGTTSGRSHRARSLLVVLQIALAVVLLVSAGLCVRSFANLHQVDLGFNPSGVLTMDLEPRDPKPSANEWLADLLAYVEAVPGVEAAGGVYLRPLALGPIGQETWVRLEGQPETPEAVRQNPTLNSQIATPGYFRAMRIELKRGRLFDARDTQQAPRVAIVSEGTARRLWPGQDPIGKRFETETFSPEEPRTAWRTVVGVVSDVRYRGLDDVRLDIYDAALQSPQMAGQIMVRTENPLTIAAAIAAEARRRDPRVIIGGITTMEAIVSRAMAPWRLSAWMFMLFATVAFALATLGLFSVVTLDVVNRSREFAVRIALGARSRDIRRRVLWSSGSRVLAGVALGVLAAMGGTRWLESLLFGLAPLDPYTYASVIALVLGVVMAASYLPARRAAGIDPITLLKRD